VFVAAGIPTFVMGIGSVLGSPGGRKRRRVPYGGPRPVSS
jgi:Ca2+-transporting ATPase